MTKSWIDTLCSDDTVSRQEQKWRPRFSDEPPSDEPFWFDEIKKLKEDPIERYQMALQNLPLPAAFREAAIATRQIIRAKRKAKTDYSEQLDSLYWLAALESYGIKYSEAVQTPGSNIFELTPAEEILSGDFDYAAIGYDKLPLLNKTDKKWIIDAWGEPTAHTTLHDLRKATWRKYEKVFVREQEKSLNEMFAHMDKIEQMSESRQKINRPRRTKKKRKPHSKLTSYFLVIMAALVILLAIAN